MRGWWGRKSTPEKFDTYTRWSFGSFGLIEVGAVVPSLGPLGPGFGGVVVTLVVLHGAAMVVVVSRAMDWHRGTRDQPVRLLYGFGALTAGIGLTALAIGEYGPDGGRVDNVTGGIYGIIMVFGPGVLCFGLRERRRMYAVVGGFSVGTVPAMLAFGQPWPAALVVAVVVLLSSSLCAVIGVFSIWITNAVYELDDAREAQARLAVAEERLRFGRDLHDVMGRNLAVIALKSELAVQLARRGRAEAVEQMVEVQRIAQESQREVREVVRGYREVDLGVELLGARGVLSAAGISCEVRGEVGELAGEVQSVLGWVVREATTNVLRHGDAQRCSVRLVVSGEQVVLTVENDGASDGVGEGGSGLAGLRERLASVEGTLEAGLVKSGVFRLVATVPVSVNEVTS
ncbi:sensor histidine kinase [Streptomyces acidiscabies]|uniref:Histidine kinase n=1 Tax=Streptomyces acidiscabies TaxID=42234 RepID=A0AAP6BJ15_9ACTN|nr:histidine kinase [Streptomyces acidiscabies]MBZ3909661.1 two-component sensor histidine kinase [Streptomyces acidiscabies]MDX2965377.1 histidine kinase [Streptomyces acidiscabies]MDX3024554.1 histidine kinase [Streptomyces acidiscabies]MDX3795211.1 histidine kinase [Streptomyces acidiscabies]GAV46113.1 sensor histidine kinase DesK [Streptomyces acidiscabies]